MTRISSPGEMSQLIPSLVSPFADTYTGSIAALCHVRIRMVHRQTVFCQERCGQARGGFYNSQFSGPGGGKPVLDNVVSGEEAGSLKKRHRQAWDNTNRGPHRQLNLHSKRDTYLQIVSSDTQQWWQKRLSLPSPVEHLGVSGSKGVLNTRNPYKCLRAILGGWASLKKGLFKLAFNSRKVRKRSKACRAGLREADELLSINDKLCGELSHAQAMNLIDGGPGTLHIRVKRAPSEFQSVVLLTRSPSPRIDKEYRKPVRDVHRGALMSPTGGEDPPHREWVMSPPDSEAYYGETDSDADTVYERQRRLKRRSPSSSPAKICGRSSPEETSEMSGYESAPDAQVCPTPSPPQQSSPPGVARREVIYQPPHNENSPENSSSSTDDQSPLDGQGPNEVDSGFQEPPSLPPLVSPERAKEALLLASRGQLVPMVGPVDNPPILLHEVSLDDVFDFEALLLSGVGLRGARCHRPQNEITGKSQLRPSAMSDSCLDLDGASRNSGAAFLKAGSTRVAREPTPPHRVNGMPSLTSPTGTDGDRDTLYAELNRGESVQDKQVKEARSKCRSIAALLTDAPNPHSKGVLMFKKRRQRAKKYTLTCFGSVEGNLQRNGEDEDDEEGIIPGSESELDEDGFTSAPESGWDSDYLDILERKTPTSGLGEPDSPGLTGISGKGAQLFEQQRKKAEERVAAAAPMSEGTEVLPAQGPMTVAPVMPATPAAPTTPITPTTTVNYSMMNGDSTIVSRASMVMSPPLVNGVGAGHTGSSLNRTAQPFAAGFVTHRATTTPVVFRPNIAKKSPPMQISTPTPTPFSAPPCEVKRAVSTTSLYIPPRPATRNTASSVLSPSSVTSVPFSPFSASSTPTAPFSPTGPATPLHAATASAAPFLPTPVLASSVCSPPAQATPYCPPPIQVIPVSQPPLQAIPFAQPPVEVTPTSQPPTQATPFSPPPVQVMSVSQPSLQATPFSPPPVQVMPVSQPSLQTTPFSPPPVQVMPVSQPSLQATPFSPPPVQVMPVSQPSLQATPFSPPPVQVMPVSQPPAQATPFPQPPVQATSYCQPSAQAKPFSPTSSQTSTSYPSPTLSTPFPPPKGVLSPPPPVAAYLPSQPLPAVNPPTPAPKVSFNPYVTVATTTPSPPALASHAPVVTQYPTANGNSAEALASREQRISVPAARTGILQEARRRGSKKPMFGPVEEKKTNSPNPELLSLVQNLDERPRAGAEAGFESGPEEDFLNLGAEACNFMQAQKNRLPPPVAPKPYTAPEGPQIPQMGGKGAELFARRQSRMDRYVVDRTAPTAPPTSPGQPRQPSPTPSLPSHWKYSPNIRAPPPISYNPLLSPSCPPGAQRGCRASEANKASKKNGAQKQAVKALDVMNRQPYQLNSAMFTYGGGTAAAPTYNQSQTSSLTAPKQVPIKAARVYNIKRFSTPTPMSAPASLTPSVIAPRSATTLGEPMWRSDIASPPPAPLSPPPAPTGALPQLPKIYTAPIPNPVPIPAPVPTLASAYDPLQSARQRFKSAPELSPLSSAPLRSAMSGSSPAIRVPRPRFSTSSMGIQANVWRPGS
ncbi:hypothetical protein JZ751_008013, partial [Albula glossodonta]